MSLTSPAGDGTFRISMEDTMRHAQRFSYGRFIALLAAAALVAGCGEGFIPEPAYQATAIPEDVTELFELSGNADSDTVWGSRAGRAGAHARYPRERVTCLPQL